MKVLIVEDSSYKLNEAKIVLSLFGINECEVASSISEALYMIYNGSFDLLIADLGLPTYPNEMVKNPLEGILMLQSLAHKDILVPTIVFSTTDIPEEDTRELEEFDFPFIGQARDTQTLRNLIQIHLEDSRNNANKYCKSMITVGQIHPWPIKNDNNLERKKAKKNNKNPWHN